MKSNAPKNYVCPICLGNQGIENEDTLLKQSDLVFRDDLVSVWINSFWIKGNEGHVIIVPNEHFENIYELPDEVGHRIFGISKLMSKTLKKFMNAMTLGFAKIMNLLVISTRFTTTFMFFQDMKMTTLIRSLLGKASCLIPKIEINM